MTIRAEFGRAPLPAEQFPNGRETVVERLRRGLSEANLDCGCRDAANEMLDQVDGEAELVRRADALVDARKMRDAIVLVLALLGELDALMPDEPDRSAFDEIAGLFQDVADFAAFGATAARRAGGHG